MAWTYAQLKTAILALNPAYTTLGGNQNVANTINAQTTSGLAAPTDISGYQFIKCVHYAEAAVLTAQQQSWLATLMLMPVIPGGPASLFFTPLISSVAAQMPLTVAALTALGATLTQPTWQPPVTAGDVQTALVQP